MSSESDQEQEKQVIEPEVVGAGDDPFQAPGEHAGEDEVPATGFMRVLWIGVALVCGVYIFIPEFTDVIPFIGWLDEVTAGGIVLFALRKAGLRIPLIQPVLDWFIGRKKKV